jgi:hypothetical protein
MALAGTAGRAGEHAAALLDPSHVAWTELRFVGQKLGEEATVDIRLTPVPADGVFGTPVAPARGGAAMTRGPNVLLLESTARLPDRTFQRQEWLDPTSAAALRIIDTETGARDHQRYYSLSSGGFTFEEREPASSSEAALSPDRWSRQTRLLVTFPPRVGTDAVVMSPAGLLYAVSASDLSATGDTLSLYVLAQRQLEEVTVRVAGRETVNLDYVEESAGHESRTIGPAEAVRLAVHSQPVDPASASGFHLFGLERDVELLWDPRRRVLLEMAGEVRLLGRIEVWLVRARLR